MTMFQQFLCPYEFLLDLNFLYLSKNYRQTSVHSLVFGIMSNTYLSFCWTFIMRLAPPAQRLACWPQCVWLGKCFFPGPASQRLRASGTWALTCTPQEAAVPHTPPFPLSPAVTSLCYMGSIYLYLVLGIKHSRAMSFKAAHRCVCI